MNEGATPANGPSLRFLPIVFGLIHLLVDASTISAVETSATFHELRPFWFFYFIVAYDLLAFATQPLLGHLTDRLRVFRGALLLGLSMVLGGMLLKTSEPIITLLLSGIGNALFHLGAGAFVLHVEPGRATPAGVFVGPGAVGVVLAKYLVKNDLVLFWPFVLALAAALALAWLYRYPVIPRVDKPRMLEVDRPLLAALLLLFSVFVRSFVGFAGAYQCPRSTAIAFGFGFAGFAGKSLGGIVGDRLGWIRAGVGVLLISAPLIAFGGANYVMVTIGLFLFQMTMPITLVAMFVLLPGRPAYAFGLTCLAYIVGAIPTFYPHVRAFYSAPAFLALIVLSAVTLYAGLRPLQGRVPMKFSGPT